MNKKVEMFCNFIFLLALCRASIVFLTIIPFFVFKELGWIGIVLEILCFIAALLDFRDAEKKKKARVRSEKEIVSNVIGCWNVGLKLCKNINIHT